MTATTKHRASNTLSPLTYSVAVQAVLAIINWTVYAFTGDGMALMLAIVWTVSPAYSAFTLVRARARMAEFEREATR